MISELTPGGGPGPLAAAKLWAGLLQAVEVEPLHVLLALLDEEGGRAAQMLLEQGLDPDQLRRALIGDAAAQGPRPPPADPVAEIPLSMRGLVRAARGLAVDLGGDATVASEHLLLALLQVSPPLLGQLQGLGLDCQLLEKWLTATQPPPLNLEEPLELLEPTDQVDAARILDANANRAREALRAVEDYCRFVLDDAHLSGELKGMRHALQEALAALPAGILLEARDTERDVGVGLRTPTEETRHSLEAVVQANWKRLQESLRTLEEYGKLQSPTLGRALEAIRYRSYTLERILALGKDARARLADAGLYVLLSRSLCLGSLEWTIKEAAAGGAQAFQLREKALPDREHLELARNVRRWTRQAGALFIQNDRPDLARLAEADGVHVGQEELSVKDVRRVAGPGMLIGVSTHDLDQLRRAIQDGAGYVGVGPTFPSGTKGFPQLAGLEFVRLAARETSLPAFAIGGITLENVGQIVAAGLRRVAVSQAICQAEDPQAAARAFCRALNLQA